MARTPSAAQVLGHVVLVTGKEEYLSARTVASVRDAVRAHDAEAEMADFGMQGAVNRASADHQSAPDSRADGDVAQAATALPCAPKILRQSRAVDVSINGIGAIEHAA